jgi:hypothetical protein
MSSWVFFLFLCYVYLLVFCFSSFAYRLHYKFLMYYLRKTHYRGTIKDLWRLSPRTISSQPCKSLVNMWLNWSSQIPLIAYLIEHLQIFFSQSWMKLKTVDLELLLTFGHTCKILVRSLRYVFWFFNALLAFESSICISSEY